MDLVVIQGCWAAMGENRTGSVDLLIATAGYIGDYSSAFKFHSDVLRCRWIR